MRKLWIGLALTALVMDASWAAADAAAVWVSMSGGPRPATVENPASLTRSADDGLSFTCAYAGFESFDVATRQGTFSRIAIPGFTHTLRLGEPALPLNRQIVAVPLGAEVTAEAVSFDRREISLADAGVRFPVMPAQPSLSKSERPQDVPFAYNAQAYSRSGFDERPLVSVQELGILRGLRLFAVDVEPVRYDPSRQLVAVCNHIQVEVRFTGGDAAATRHLRERTWSPYFESLYSQFVLNYRRASTLDDDLVRYPIKYVIVANPMFTAQLQPFIAWKKQKGFNVIVAYKGDAGVGSTATTIKNYLQTLYNAGTPQDPAPSFVLFVGDTAQIPTWSGGTDTHFTDLNYVRLAGGDYLPEIYFGRFSANSTSELQPQIDKTLEYERYQMPDPSYLSRVVMIAGADATYAPTYGNGQINYGTDYYFNVAHGITSNTYLYPASGSSDAQVIANASDGRGYMNYTAHGSETSWADPTFTVTDVANLTNAHKYGTVVGNCCLTNSFQVTTCFGEAWLRAANKGAIGYIGGSNSTYWDEDYWWGVGSKSVQVNPPYDATHRGAYDGMFHDHGETFPTWYTTQYGFIMAGNLAVTQAASSLTNYYWEIYQLMGDPSVSTYLGVPTANTVNYPDPLFLGQTSLTVTADAYSYVGFSMGGQLLAAGLVGESGSLTLNFGALTSPGTAYLVITRQARIPVIDSIQVIASSGPYLVTSAVQISDVAGGDGDGLCDFGEALTFTLTEQNIGTENANGVTVEIAAADPYLTITDASELYGLIPAGGQVTKTDGFAAALSPDVPDGRVIPVSVTATDDEDNEFADTLDITAHAPAIQVSSTAVNDASGNNNGVMDAGETVSLTLTLQNGGSAGASALAGTLSTDCEHITVTQPTGTLAALNAGGSGSLSAFGLTVSPTAPAMERTFFYLELTMSGGRTDHFIIEMSIGGFSDAVENGAGAWTHQSNGTGWLDEWHISTRNLHSPTHAWWCGDEGTGTYTIHTDAVLITPSISLSGHTELRFWHKMDAETSGTYADSAYDGGILYISLNGGAWTTLTPTTNGYNKWVRAKASSTRPYNGPLPPLAPCFSGSLSWREVVCDLASYSGPVRFRFRFGSDSATVRGGWYVDDVRVALVIGNNPPRNLEAQLAGSDAQISWQSPSSGVFLSVLGGYNLYRNGAKIDSLLHSLSYADDLDGLPFGWYRYAVSAQYGSSESGLSNTDSVNWNGLAPDAVTDLVIMVSGQDVILYWSSVPRATSYRVYASDTVQDFSAPPVTEVSDSTCTLVGETASRARRFYLVTAVR
ncbi:MAG: C25 family cysteine peptidase [bacterium]|nr:C25 family cysteine peptidase [bacterium]